MAETTKAELRDEVSELRDQIKQLEADLQNERESQKHKTKPVLEDEAAELRDRIKVLEQDLKDERSNRGRSWRDKSEVTRSLDKVNDQMTKLTRGLFFAGLEAMAMSAKFTREFVDRTDERNTPDRRDTWAKMMTDLPADATRGFTDALENSANDIEKVVDKFYAKYKE